MANVLVDSIALRKLISAESRAVADGVKRTFLLFLTVNFSNP